MRITPPFKPLRIKTTDMCHTVELANKSYTFDADGMISSVIADGVEVLAEPMRIVMVEDGESAVFDSNYTENESESFIQSRSDEKAVICGCKQSDRFIIDFCNFVGYDGNIDISLKLMPRGRTVREVFGLSEMRELSYKLDKMWLEIPIKKEIATFYHIYENSDIFLSDGSVISKSDTSSGGRLPHCSACVPFKPLLWLGNDERGLGWFSESDRNWQPDNINKAIEIVNEEDKVIIRVHLLDSHPVSWMGDLARGFSCFKPIEFHFGFAATPVKPYPKNPYIHKALHIDCGIKIKGNYMDFFSQENRFDRLVEKGVDTLILHEKWNKSQNWFELSEYTSKQLTYIVDECHKRGIKVMPYFGYEISAMSPVWQELKDKVTVKDENSVIQGGWWRVPFQRDYRVCYNSEYADLFIDGIAKIMDTYNIDGIYLDSTSRPNYCANTEHGCGWYDEGGKLHGTYNIKAVQRLFERLYKVVHSRGGQINVHCFACMNFTTIPYINQLWLGENLQKELCRGTTQDVNTDHFRVEYSGRNFGIPTEFIVYENRPKWNFEQALSCSILHGILPRPNDIEYPLDLMSEVWGAFDKFPFEKSEWKPYWNNGSEATNDKVKISYYKYTSISGEPQLLAFAVNISSENIRDVTIKFTEKVKKVIDAITAKTEDFTFDILPYGYKILFIS